MTLFQITHWDCSGAHSIRIGQTKQEKLSKGDVLEYQTDEGETVLIGIVEKVNPDYDEDFFMCRTFYETEEGKTYEIVDEEKTKRHLEEIGFY